MNTSLRVWALIVVLLSLVGCQSGMIKISSVDGQNIGSELSQDQIQAAIKLGAVTAGWRVDEVSDNRMLATYRIRGHTVIVAINYSADEYSIQYENSIQMKVKCGREHDATEPAKVTTGERPCPGGAPPTYIHQNYEDWLEGLNRSIQVALQSA
jgi:hypothetical protein